MNIIRKLFGREHGAKSRPMAEYVDQVRIGRNSHVQVGPPTAFPFSEGINSSVAKLLSQYDSVVAAYIVQMTYLDNPDMSPGGRPCLTLCLEYQKPNEVLHDQISVATQKVIDGKLGKWGFLDMLAASPDVIQAAGKVTRPLYKQR